MNIKDQKAAYERAIDKPMAAIDINPLIIRGDGKIILAKRISTVQEGGKWSMPGGKVFVGETIEEALKRMALLKTGLEIELFSLTLNSSLIGIYDDPGRDPRAHVIGAAFYCQIIGGEMQPGGNSEEVKAFTWGEMKSLDLAFDHKQIFRDAAQIRLWAW